MLRMLRMMSSNCATLRYNALHSATVKTASQNEQGADTILIVSARGRLGSMSAYIGSLGAATDVRELPPQVIGEQQTGFRRRLRPFTLTGQLFFNPYMFRPACHAASRW